MAQIQEEVVIIKLSKLVKDVSEGGQPLTNGDFEDTVESIVQELVDSSIIVEVEKGIV